MAREHADETGAHRARSSEDAYRNPLAHTLLPNEVGTSLDALRMSHAPAGRPSPARPLHVLHQAHHGIHLSSHAPIDARPHRGPRAASSQVERTAGCPSRGGPEGSEL